MLIRISLIIAILAGLAVGTLNFIKVKEKVVTLQTTLKEQTDLKDKALAELGSTKKELAKTTTELKQTKATLEATTADKNKAEAEVATQTKRADKLNDDLTKTREERDTAQQELAAFHATGLTPEGITKINKQYKGLEAALATSETENQILVKKLNKT